MGYKPRDTFVGWITGWAVLCAIGWLTLSIVHDTQGRQAFDHARPLPASVKQLSPSAYLLTDTGAISGNDLCAPDASSDRVVSSKIITLPTGQAVYTQCGRDQEWGVDKPRSDNLGRSAIYVATKPYVFGPAIILFLLALIPGTAHVILNARKRRQKRKQKLADTEQQRVELAAAYAQDKISQPEFEKALNNLYKL